MMKSRIFLASTLIWAQALTAQTESVDDNTCKSEKEEPAEKESKDDKEENKDKDENKECKKSDNDDKDDQDKKDDDEDKPDIANSYNVSVFPESECRKFFFGVDYLLWTANQEGLSYATLINLSQTPPTFLPISLHEQDLFLRDAKWRSGVRGFLGFQPKDQSWDLRACYTYYWTGLDSGQQSASLADGNGSYLIDDYISNSSNTTLDWNSGNHTTWELWYNLLDIDFGHEFFVAKDAFLRPFFGFRGLDTRQKLEETLLGLSQINEETPIPGTIFLDAKNRFSGVGVKVGCDVSYSLAENFDLYGSLTGGLVWGRFKVEQSLELQSIIPVLGVVLIEDNLERSFRATSLTVDTAVGIRLNFWLCKDSKLLSFRFGWEQHLYTKMNQFQTLMTGGSIPQSPIVFDRNVQRGDLTLQGFILGSSFEF